MDTPRSGRVHDQRLSPLGLGGWATPVEVLTKQRESILFKTQADLDVRPVTKCACLLSL